MPPTFPSDDTLGPVTWDGEYRWWKFEAGPPGGPPIRGKIIPEGEGALPPEEWLRLIRACVAWLRANEPRLRHRVAADMFDYWCQTYCNEDDEVETVGQFAAAIRTTGVNFTEGCPAAEVFYDDAGLFGNHGIRVEIDPAGAFVRGPDFA